MGSELAIEIGTHQPKGNERYITVAVLGKIFGSWPLTIWEATTARPTRNYYRTN